LSLALVALGATASAQSAGAHTEEPAVEAPASSSAEELLDKRTGTSDTYELHSGPDTGIDGVPVNHEDAEGEWQPIEEGEGREIVNGAQGIGSRLLAMETEPAEVSEGAAVYDSLKPRPASRVNHSPSASRRRSKSKDLELGALP
jgi:hypothetical protein